MCVPGQPPATVVAAALAAEEALGSLAVMEMAPVPANALAEGMRSLERAEARLLAARSAMLTTFATQGGYLDDGQQSARSWLRWQTRVTLGAASAATRWARRLAAHPAVAAALAAAVISVSWAEKVCGWTERLPEEHRGAADQILLDAAKAGADLCDLSALAEEIYRRTAGPDTGDGDDGFTGRSVRLDRTFGGGGSLTGSLTPACAAALEAWLESLGKRFGPEDTRTLAQRTHDALEEGARRLVTTGALPDRAGQPAQVQLLIPFDRLKDMPGADDAMAEWAAKAAADGRPGWLLDRAAAEGYACDAVIAPVVTGQVDLAALAQLTTTYLDKLRRTKRWHPGATWPPPPPATGADTGPLAPGPAIGALPPKTLRRLQNTLLAQAADVLSGPTGLAAFLRTRLLATDYPPIISRALDIGADTATVPPYLRRALVLRGRHCEAPGCRRPPIDCHAHHIVPRSHGGATALHNLLLLCPFHHLTMIHRWGWTIHLNTDGTTTMTSPNGQRTLHSHGPPTPTTA